MQTIQDNLPIPISVSLITPAKSVLPCKVTHSQVTGIGQEHLGSGEGVILFTYILTAKLGNKKQVNMTFSSNGEES